MPDQEKTRGRLVIDERPTFTVLEKIRSLLSLNFKDRDLENAFQADYFQKSLLRIRLSILFAVFLYGMFGLLDEYIIPEVKHQAWIIRYVIFCPLAIVVFLLSYLKSFQRLLELFFTILGFIAGAGIITMIALAEHPGSDFYYAGLLLCSMFYFIFVGLRFISATILSWAIFVVYEITAIWIKGISTPILINNSFFFIAFNITGMWACYSIERYMRSDFMQRRTILEQSDKLSMIFDNSPVGILHFNHEGKITDCNPSLEAIVGSSREKIIGLNIITDLNDDRVITAVKQALSGQMSHCEGKYVSVTTKKTTVGKSDFAPIITPDGTVVGGVGIVEDVTERQKTEKALRESEERYRAVVENAGVGIDMLDQDGRVISANQALCNMLGYSIGELKELTFPDITHPDDREISRGNLQALMAGDIDSYRLEKRYLRKNGDIVWGDLSVSDIQNAEGEHVGTVGVIANITKRKRAEQEKEALQAQLFQSQKMEALGTLVGGIAHDFNNMLQIMLGYSQLLLDDKKKGQPGYKELQTIIETGKGGADLVKKLLAFGQQGQVFPVPLDLNHQISQLSTLISRTLPQVVQVDLDLADGPTTIRADHGKIDQLVMNLAINASEAMPNGGTLKIATTTVSLDEEFCRTLRGAKSGNYVMLSITDTGRGIDKAMLARIFDPFFSTKERGSTRGTGLGLSVVKGIVQQQGGHVTCESEPDKGTEFKIYFPAIEVPLMTANTVVPTVQSEGAETILVVEDNIPVAEFERRVLANAGYTVIVVNNGKEALDIYQTRREEISLVILDLLMPEMSGRDCLMELLKIDPSVKVLIASGYAPEDELHKEISPLVRGFVHKPFGIAELLNEARSVLDRDWDAEANPNSLAYHRSHL
ncbi:MAG: PAS domain S-box protein [Deltaproteobacteria bacterium]|nr:PAS domain S-box protein [Deltaproteobacteria bacterium]